MAPGRITGSATQQRSRHVRIYGPRQPKPRGTVTFNLYDPQGHLLDYRRVEELAGEEGISVRTGCFCNPGRERWPRID